MKGRMRIHLLQNRMTYEQADILLYFLTNMKTVSSAKVYERTQDAVIRYTGDREVIIEEMERFSYEKTEVPAGLLENSGRALNAAYQEKVINKVLFGYARKWFLPYPVNALYTTAVSLKYIYKGLKVLCKGKIEVPVLDATAIGVSILRNDIDTAGGGRVSLGSGHVPAGNRRNFRRMDT